MRCYAALAGAILLATYPAMAQGVSGSVNVTGGATPSVTTSATTASTATGTSSSQSSSDPVITNSGNTGSSILTNRNGARSNAQGGNARSNAQGGRASAATSSRSQGGAGGYAGAVGNQVQVNLPDPPAASTTGYTGYSGTTTQNYSGGYTLRNVPEIVAPSVNGGANGCAVGVSGGVAVAGFGFTSGAGWSDSNCERRNLAALVYNTGDHDLAAEILCDAAEVRAARLRMGKPCIADQQSPSTVTTAVTQVEHVDPAILRRQQDSLEGPMRVGGAAATPVAEAHRRPDWCETASPQELRSHHDCD